MDRRDLSKKKFDQTFRDKLEEVEHKPPSSNWDAIELELPAKKSFLWTGRYWTILVLSAFLIGSLSYTLNWHQQDLAEADRSVGGMMGEPLASLASLEAIPLTSEFSQLSISQSPSLASRAASFAGLNLINSVTSSETVAKSNNSNQLLLASEPAILSGPAETSAKSFAASETRANESGNELTLVEHSVSRMVDSGNQNETAILPLAELPLSIDSEEEVLQIASPAPIKKIAKLKSRGLFFGAVGQYYYSKVLNASTNLNKQNITRLRTSQHAMGLRFGYNFSTQLSVVGEYHFHAQQGQRYQSFNRGAEEDVNLSLVQIPVYMEIRKYLGAGLTGLPILLNSRLGFQYSRLQSANINVAYRAASNTNAEDFLMKHYLGVTMGTGADFYLSQNIYFSLGLHGVVYRDLTGLQEMSKTLTTNNYHLNFGANASLNFRLK